MTHLNTMALLLSGLLLVACGDTSDEPKSSANDPALDTIELGTAVKDVIAPTRTQNDADNAFKDLAWEDLVPADFQPDAIMNKYRDQIEAAGEGSEEERVLYDKVMSEFNSVGSNTALNGQLVRIPGFVAPLDSNAGTVLDFLLVPYYGSCIHSPPPPENQTVMVSPVKGKSITLEQTYHPVWVIGELEAKTVDTDLAKAGYQIKNARVEPYTYPEN